MQGTEIKMTTPALRATFTPNGDIAPDLQQMWSIASSVVLAIAKPIVSLMASSERQHEHGGERTHADRDHADNDRAARHRKHAHPHRGHRMAGRHRARHVAQADR